MSVNKKGGNYQQMSLFSIKHGDMIDEIIDTYSDLGKVCLDLLCEKNLRLALARKIAAEQHFMHWELEFANLFTERRGFDLIIGNPPWILMGWNEQITLSDNHPMFAIRNLTATQTV
ncbi:MAG: hypothetical protein LBM69_09200, partial [Lachnospiraceae bacterium]|nr:hypothetical protein [Lachnospiraceae bacterium]